MGTNRCAFAGTFALLALNDGTGAFTAAGPPMDVSYAAIFALTPALADLDGDGDLDLAVGGPGSITTLLADGTGGLAAPQLTPISASLDYITTADVDEDGIPDLIGFQSILDPTTGVIAYGDGAGGVADVHKVATGTSLGSDGTPAREVDVTDLEGDGDPDILFLGGSLGVLENATDGRRPSH